MAGRFDFVSPGASATNALMQFLVEAETRRRQAMLDELAKQREARADSQEARMAEFQKKQFEDLAHQREFTRAERIDQNAVPGDALDTETAALLRRHGFGGAIKAAPKSNVPPAFLMVEPGNDDILPDAPRELHRGGSKWLAARTAAQERAERAADELEYKRERDAAANELKELIARMTASNSAETRELASEFKRLQIQREQDKLDTAKKEKADKALSIASARAQVRHLAQGLIDDPNLDAIVGPLAGRTPDVLPTSVDVAARLQQLVNTLSLEAREKLKGQGAVSNYEGDLLARAQTAIDRKANPDILKGHLRKIVEAFQGDVPNAAPRETAATEPISKVQRNTRTGETRTVYSYDGGATWGPRR